MSTTQAGWVRRHLFPDDVSGLTALASASLSDEQKKSAFTIAVETRRFEIERFWQRSAFFWAFTAALFAAFGAIKITEEGDDHLRLIVGCFGFLAAEAWILQNRGARYWQEAWEQKVRALEKAVLGVDLFTNKEPVEFKGWFGAGRFSVSKLTVMFSDGCVLAWIVLIGRLVWKPVDFEGDWMPVWIIASTVALAILMPVLTRATPD